MSLLNEASFLVTPNGYKEDKLYAAIPTNGNGDMTFTRAGAATRVNEAGLVELVPYNLLLRSEEFDNIYWLKERSSITPNAVIAPDGTLTSDKLVEDTSTNTHYLWRYIGSVSNGDIKTFSVFVKKAERSVVRLEFFGVSGFFGVFDLDKLTVTAGGMYGGTSPSSTSIIPLANDWYRISISGVFNISNSGQTGIGRVFLHDGITDLLASYKGDGTSGLYVWGAQLVEGSSALTYQKTVDRLDIPRIDYTDAKRTNLLTYSENFDDASFVKNLSESIETDSTIAPNGTLTADTWAGQGDFGSHYLAQTVSATSGVAYTQSVFAKKGTNNFLQIVGTGAIYDANSWANFDLENGVVGTAGASATATITDFGNGWYRCTMTATAITTASGIGFLLWLITSATAGRAEGNSLATSVYLWGAQVEEGAYATSYIPTTTGTVTIYDGCPSILLEPQRTNLVKRSQEFDNASWLKYQVSVTANALTAPDGTLTADLATVTSNSGNRLNQAVAVTASTTYTFSFYAKAGTLETSKYSVYDLTNSAYILYPVVYSMTGEWQRITLTFTTPVGCTNIWIYTSHETASGTYYVWGAQLEAGAYPTSYIPTTTGTVTRNADVCVKTGISDLLNPSEGTFYAEISALANDLTFRSLTLSDGTGNNVVQIALGNVSNQIRLDTFGGGASYRSAVTVSDTTENHKVLVKWGPSGIFGFIDGDKYTLTLAVGTGSGIPAALNRINFSVWWGGANFFYGKCKGVQIYKTALSDQQCKALTTL